MCNSLIAFHPSFFQTSKCNEGLRQPNLVATCARKKIGKGFFLSKLYARLFGHCRSGVDKSASKWRQELHCIAQLNSLHRNNCIPRGGGSTLLYKSGKSRFIPPSYLPFCLCNSGPKWLAKYLHQCSRLLEWRSSTTNSIANWGKWRVMKKHALYQVSSFGSCSPPPPCYMPQEESSAVLGECAPRPPTGLRRLFFDPFL